MSAPFPEPWSCPATTNVLGQEPISSCHHRVRREPSRSSQRNSITSCFEGSRNRPHVHTLLPPGDQPAMQLDRIGGRRESGLRPDAILRGPKPPGDAPDFLPAFQHFSNSKASVLLHVLKRPKSQPTTQETWNAVLQTIQNGCRLDSDSEPGLRRQLFGQRAIHHSHEPVIVRRQDVTNHPAPLCKAFKGMQLDDNAVSVLTGNSAQRRQ